MRRDGFPSSAQKRARSGKAATPTRAQADEAARLRQMFLDVLDGMEVAEGSTEQSGEKFSIKRTPKGVTYIEINKDAIDVKKGDDISSNIAAYFQEHFDNLIEVNGQSIRVNTTTNGEWTDGPEGYFLQKHRKKIFKDKVRTLANADELLEAATNWVGEEKNDQSNNGFNEYARSGVIIMKIGNRWYRGQVLVGTQRNRQFCRIV